jgi:hypothetical protein
VATSLPPKTLLQAVLLMLGNQEYFSDTLEELEQRLYKYAGSEGFFEQATDDPEDVTVYRIDTLEVVYPHQDTVFDTLAKAVQYARASGIPSDKIRIAHVSMPVQTVFDYTYLDEEGWHRSFKQAASDYRKSRGNRPTKSQ